MFLIKRTDIEYSNIITLENSVTCSMCTNKFPGIHIVEDGTSFCICVHCMKLDRQASWDFPCVSVHLANNLYCTRCSRGPTLIYIYTCYTWFINKVEYRRCRKCVDVMISMIERMMDRSRKHVEILNDDVASIVMEYMTWSIPLRIKMKTLNDRCCDLPIINGNVILGIHRNRCEICNRIEFGYTSEKISLCFDCMDRSISNDVLSSIDGCCDYCMITRIDTCDICDLRHRIGTRFSLGERFTNICFLCYKILKSPIIGGITEPYIITLELDK